MTLFRSRSRRSLAALAAVLLVIAAIVAACSSGGVFQNVGSNLDGGGNGGKAEAPAPATGSGSGDRSGGGTDQYATLIEQKIVKTGEVSLQVTSVADASSRVRAMAVELGGYVGGSQAGTLDQSATLTLRIPAARFDDALARLHEIGDKVLTEATREEDVTSTVVDLDARLKNLQASEAQYRALMARAAKIEDILAVQSRLDDVQGQIEQISAQLKQLTNQADLSTLTVTLQPQPEPIKEASATWDPGETASAAVGALLTVGQALLTAGIWLGIVGLPILVVLVVLVLVLLRAGLLRRPGGPAPAAPASEA